MSQSQLKDKRISRDKIPGPVQNRGPFLFAALPSSESAFLPSRWCKRPAPPHLHIWCLNRFRSPGRVFLPLDEGYLCETVNGDFIGSFENNMKNEMTLQLQARIEMSPYLWARFWKSGLGLPKAWVCWSVFQILLMEEMMLQLLLWLENNPRIKSCVIIMEVVFILLISLLRNTLSYWTESDLGSLMTIN